MDEIKLDVKDKRILFALEQDSRQSLQQIAKKAALSKEAVFHRIKRLEEKGIIRKYITEIDIYKIGYKFYPVLLKFQNTTPEIEKEIIEHLRNDRNIAWLTTCEGNWDINMTIIAKDIYELNTSIAGLVEKYGTYIAEKQVFMTTEIHYFKRGFWLNKQTTETVTTGGTETTKINEKELELLRILSDNARTPIVEIAKKLHTTPKVVAYSIKKMEDKKIIQGSRILVDFSRIGYKYYKVWFSLNSMKKEQWKKLLTYFQFNPNIIWTTMLIGSYDLSIEMEVSDTTEFRRILEDIKQQYSEIIKKHESIMIFQELALNYLPKK
jgi:DNA-binding Lrp family transcriptional regulator